MSKESGSFLRKVARFVANPTTDWSDLDAPPTPVTPSQAAGLPTVPGGSVDLPITTPDRLNPPILPFVEHAATVIEAPKTEAPFFASLAPAMPIIGATLPGGIDVQVVEMAHDPELDEAVIAFANADFDQCEQCLLSLVHPGSARHEHAETWLVLFDFYRALDLPHKFDNLAVSYAQQFGVSAPQWYSLPQRVADLIESESAGAAATASPEPASGRPSLSAPLEFSDDAV